MIYDKHIIPEYQGARRKDITFQGRIERRIRIAANTVTTNRPSKTAMQSQLSCPSFSVTAKQKNHQSRRSFRAL